MAAIAAEAVGSAVFAIRRLQNPAIPATTPTGPGTTGTHIIVLPKLALSCSKVSAAATSDPAAVNAETLGTRKNAARGVDADGQIPVSPPIADALSPQGQDDNNDDHNDNDRPDSDIHG